MAVFLAVSAVSLVWAIYAFLSAERRYRAAWSDAEQAAIEVGAVRPRLARAPWLVRLTAFACLWIGQSVAVVMFVPGILFWRGGGIAIGTIESTTPWRHSFLAYELGTLLLQRHRQALFTAASVAHLLRIVAGALAVVAAFGFMGGHAWRAVWWVLLGYAVLTAALTGMVSFLVRLHSAAFADVAQDRSWS